MCKSIPKLISLIVCILFLHACGSNPKSSSGFRLPDGDAVKGQALFVEFQCNTCHTITGLELAAPLQTGPVAVVLGGPVARVKTYGDLVSSVINPSHKLIFNYPDEDITRDGESLMRIYNETMTVQQLIDLVAFLQPQYRVTLPQYSYYTFKY